LFHKSRLCAQPRERRATFLRLREEKESVMVAQQHSAPKDHDNPRRDAEHPVPRTDTDASGRKREPRQPGMGEDEERHYVPEREREGLTD
jgi:hypothetical protein